MIRCPQTGHPIPTGYEADPVQFREMPVFFAVSYCPICRADHQWFARDAWVRAHASDLKQRPNAGRLAPVWPGTRTLALRGEEEPPAMQDRGTR